MSSAQSGPKDVLDLSPVSHQFQAIPQGIAPEKEPGAAPGHLKYLGVLLNIVELYVCITGGMFHSHTHNIYIYLIGSMYAIYGNIYHQYTPNVSIYTIHGSYGYRYRYNVGYRWWSQWEIRTGESGNLYTESCFTCHVRSDRSLAK